jgi:hypothetical protein
MKTKKLKPKIIKPSTKVAAAPPSASTAVASNKQVAKSIEESPGDPVTEDGKLDEPPWLKGYRKSLQLLLRTADEQNVKNRELADKALLFEKVFAYKVCTT